MTLKYIYFFFNYHLRPEKWHISPTWFHPEEQLIQNLWPFVLFVSILLSYCGAVVLCLNNHHDLRWPSSSEPVLTLGRAVRACPTKNQPRVSFHFAIGRF